METINFVQNQAPVETTFDKVRKLAVAVTTGLLVIYVICISGYLGYSWYWGDKEVETNSELTALTGQISRKSVEEVLVRKIDWRGRAIKDFLNSRVDMSLAAHNLQSPGIRVLAWTVDGSQRQVVMVGADSPQELESYAMGFLTKNATVQINKSEWTPEFGWTVTLRLGGLVL